MPEEDSETHGWAADPRGIEAKKILLVCCTRRRKKSLQFIFVGRASHVSPHLLRGVHPPPNKHAHTRSRLVHTCVIMAATSEEDASEPAELVAALTHLLASMTRMAAACTEIQVLRTFLEESGDMAGVRELDRVWERLESHMAHTVHAIQQQDAESGGEGGGANVSAGRDGDAEGPEH